MFSGVNPWDCDVWTEALLKKEEIKRKRRHRKGVYEGEGSHFEFLYILSMTFSCTPCPSLLFFSPFHWNRCSSIPDYFYPPLHYHNKTHAWKKDKLKETAQPKTWILEAYFHLSFLSSILLCCSFLFAQRNGKRHAFSFSLCLIMVLFRSFEWGQPAALHRHSGAAGGLPRLTSTLRWSHQPLQQTPLPKCSMNVTCFNKCSQRAMPRLNQQQQLPYHRHQCGQYI